jgi:hypothetical protein
MSGTVLRPDVEHAPTFKPGDRIVVTDPTYRTGETHTIDFVSKTGCVYCGKLLFAPDLVAPTVPVHESFHNVYSERTGNMRVSRRAADRNADPDRLAVVHIRLWADGAVTADVEQVTT